MDASHLEFGSHSFETCCILSYFGTENVLTHELNERKRVGVCGIVSQGLKK